LIILAVAIHQIEPVTYTHRPTFLTYQMDILTLKVKISPTCLSLPDLSFDILHDDIWKSLKFDLSWSQNDLEMTFKVKIFRSIHPRFFSLTYD